MKFNGLLMLLIFFVTAVNGNIINQPNQVHADNEVRGISHTLYKRDILPFFSPLIKELRKKGFPIEYVIKSLMLIDKIEFVSFEGDVSGTYNKISNKIELDIDFVDHETGRLKKYSELKLIHLKTLYHELWHVYYNKHIKVKKPLFYYLYKKQMLRTYSGEIYANVIQGEAYGIFIGLAIQNYYQHYAILKYLGEDGRRRLYEGHKVEQMIQRYAEVLNYPVSGHYFNPLHWGIVDHETNLPAEDRDLIFKYVLNNEISQKFIENFSEQVFSN